MSVTIARLRMAPTRQRRTGAPLPIGSLGLQVDQRIFPNRPNRLALHLVVLEHDVLDADSRQRSRQKEHQ